MRLICGFMRLDGAPASQALLDAMVAQIFVPRLGPAVTAWTGGPVGLAVLDFATALRGRKGVGAPLPSRGALTLAADVRLDAPAELGRQLRIGRPCADDELLLATLDDTETSGLEHVLGDFAFACWNDARRTLLCGRDVFGIRPLSYVHKPGELFAFASLPQALYGAGIVPRTVDEAVLLHRIMRIADFSEDSLVAGIRQLPAAHLMEVSPDRVQLRRYWQLDRAAIGKRACSLEEAAAGLRRVVTEAVACRLRGGGSIGTHLSGGLDSSAITVLAARQLREEGRKLHAYSFLDRHRNDVPVVDDTPFVDAVLRQETGIDWTPIRAPVDLSPSPRQPIEMSLDEHHPEFTVCQTAERQGVELVLSGWGGDEAATFDGRGTLAAQFLQGRWRTLMRNLATIARSRRTAVNRVFRSEVLSYCTPTPIRNAWNKLAKRPPGFEQAKRALLTPAARRRWDAAGRERLAMAPDADENRWRLMVNGHIAFRAETWAQTGARHGVAFAFPLLDRRVVEYALSLPSDLFLHGGVQRRPFREAMAGVLPENIRQRTSKRAPFPSQVIDLVEAKTEILARVDGYAKSEAVCRIVDIAELRRVVEAFPSPDAVRQAVEQGRNPDNMVMLATAMRMLGTAAYIEQHVSN